jgi:hypothetical protein
VATIELENLLEALRDALSLVKVTFTEPLNSVLQTSHEPYAAGKCTQLCPKLHWGQVPNRYPATMAASLRLKETHSTPSWHLH